MSTLRELASDLDSTARRVDAADVTAPPTDAFLEDVERYKALHARFEQSLAETTGLSIDRLRGLLA